MERKRMIVGKYYRITGSYFNSFAPELSPQGTIVRCIGEYGNGIYNIRLEDNCGKVLKQKKGIVQGWLYHLTDQKNTYEELSIRDIRKLKLKKVNKAI